MGLLDVLRVGVAVANSVTADLQPEVTHRVFVHASGKGKKDFLDVPRRAIVTKQQKLVKTSSGEMKMSTAQICFLDPGVVMNELDEIILPDGSGGTVLATNAFVDRGTGGPLLTEVYLG